eukprot:8689751-Pyramimonas_sp.AAC.1
MGWRGYFCWRGRRRERKRRVVSPGRGWRGYVLVAAAGENARGASQSRQPRQPKRTKRRLARAASCAERGGRGQEPRAPPQRPCEDSGGCQGGCTARGAHKQHTAKYGLPGRLAARVCKLRCEL